MGIYKISRSALIKRLSWAQDPLKANASIANFGADAAHFAKVSLDSGTNSMLYTFDDGDWKPLADCSPDVAQKVRQEVEALRNRLVLAQGNDISDVTTVPGDKHVLVNGLGNFVLIGWGHTVYPQRDATPIVVDNPTSKATVEICFLNNGALCADRSFKINNGAELKTDDKGVYVLRNMEMMPGSALPLVDLKTNKTFSIVLDRPFRRYEFDVTRHASLQVEVREDGLSVGGEKVSVVAAGVSSGELTTDAAGLVSQSIILLDDAMTASVVVRGEKREVALVEGDNKVFFNFKKPVVAPPPPPPAPVPPSPKPTSSVRVVVRRDGLPVYGEAVLLRGLGQGEQNAWTGVDGVADFPFESCEAHVSVVVNGVQQEKHLQTGESAEFIFDLSDTETVECGLRVVYSDDKPVVEFPVSVVMQGVPAEYWTDDEGRVPTIGRCVPGEGFDVSTKVDPDLKAHFVVSQDEKEYVWKLPFENADCDTEVIFIDKDERRVGGAYAVFRQGTTKFLCHTDSEGSCAIARGSFDETKDISVVATSRERQLPECVFRLEKDKTVYELRETADAPWWKRLLNVVLWLIAAYVVGLFGVQLACSLVLGGQ